MKWLIVGHRGTGKSSLLSRVEKYFAGKVRCFDLDAEVVKAEDLTVDEIFSQKGELYFRQAELKILAQLATQDNIFVASGAGLELGPDHFGFRVLWLRRSTDKGGRIFLNRPRLDSNVTALEEFQNRFEQREPRYLQNADEILTGREGFEFANEFEKAYFLDEIHNIGGVVTLLPQHFEHDLKFFLERRVQWGIEFFELRDDLLLEEQFDQVAKLTQKLLVSFRDPKRTAASQEFISKHNAKFDWPLDWKEKPKSKGYVGSLHPPGADFDLQEIDSRAQEFEILKLAVPIRTFAELEKFHRWHLKQPKQNVFLPMSDGGRWRWYRLLTQDKMRLQFWRDGESVAADQPLLLERLAQQKFQASSRFAAILGDPVEQSRTPAEQFAFFEQHNMNVYAIQINEQEFTEEVLAFLAELGLKVAAVTSPLKDRAAQLCPQKDALSTKLGSVNTMVLGKDWQGANTDVGGLAALIQLAGLGKIEQGEIAVWGGGGVLQGVRELLPHAQYFSVRTGLPREGAIQGAAPKAIIWAATYGQDQPPPKEWRPFVVVDLNYAENSGGRSYAADRGIRYVSGLEMFRAQAKLQREFWLASGSLSSQ